MCLKCVSQVILAGVAGLLLLYTKPRLNHALGAPVLNEASSSVTCDGFVKAKKERHHLPNS